MVSKKLPPLTANIALMSDRHFVVYFKYKGMKTPAFSFFPHIAQMDISGAGFHIPWNIVEYKYVS
jgi:hypothetical protein